MRSHSAQIKFRNTSFRSKQNILKIRQLHNRDKKTCTRKEKQQFDR